MPNDEYCPMRRRRCSSPAPDARSRASAFFTWDACFTATAAAPFPRLVCVASVPRAASCVRSRERDALLLLLWGLPATFGGWAAGAGVIRGSRRGMFARAGTAKGTVLERRALKVHTVHKHKRTCPQFANEDCWPRYSLRFAKGVEETQAKAKLKKGCNNPRARTKLFYSGDNLFA